jgi:hypothetical protein
MLSISNDKTNIKSKNIEIQEENEKIVKMNSIDPNNSNILSPPPSPLTVGQNICDDKNKIVIEEQVESKTENDQLLSEEEQVESKTENNQLLSEEQVESKTENDQLLSEEQVESKTDNGQPVCDDQIELKTENDQPIYKEKEEINENDQSIFKEKEEINENDQPVLEEKEEIKTNNETKPSEENINDTSIFDGKAYSKSNKEDQNDTEQQAFDSNNNLSKSPTKINFNLETPINGVEKIIITSPSSDSIKQEVNCLDKEQEYETYIKQNQDLNNISPILGEKKLPSSSNSGSLNIRQLKDYPLAVRSISSKSTSIGEHPKSKQNPPPLPRKDLIYNRRSYIEPLYYTKIWIEVKLVNL